jgi:hypothetical protein
MPRNGNNPQEVNNTRGNGAAPAIGENAAPGEAGFDLAKYAYKPPSSGPVKREQLTIPEGRPKDTFFRIDRASTCSCRFQYSNINRKADFQRMFTS